MKQRLFAALRALAIPLVGSLRYAFAMGVLVWAWFFDARLLNAAFDVNLAAIKWIGAALDGSGRIEAALRSLSAERMLLFTEAGILVWVVGKIAWFPISCLMAARRAMKSPPAEQASRPTFAAGRMDRSRPKS